MFINDIFGDNNKKLDEVSNELIKKIKPKKANEDAIDDRFAAQYNTPQALAKSQTLDQLASSGTQADYDRLGVMSPQQIERDYQAMRAKEPEQDAAVYRNPALTPSARSMPTFKTNPKGVPIKEEDRESNKNQDQTTVQSSNQKSQLRKDVDAVDYNKQQQPSAAPSAEQKAGIRQAVSDYNKEKVKEQDDFPDEDTLQQQGSERGRFPHYYDKKDSGATFELKLKNGKKYTVKPGHPEWDTLYKQHFDLPTPNDYGPGRGWHIGKNPVVEAGPFSYGAKKPKKGSVADLAAQKRKEQEKGKQPVEPRDHMVGVARVVKDVAEGFLGDRTFNRVMPMVKRIAGEVSDYDRDEFGEELWSLLDQKYGPKFAQSVLQDELDFYWNEYTELTGQDLAEGSVTPDVNVKKIYDDGNIKEWHIYRGKEMIGYVVKNLPNTAEGLYIASGYGPGRGFTEEFNGLKSAVKYITNLDNQGVAEGLNEFAPSGGGGGRWYSDDQLYDIIGEDWLEAFDVSGDQGNIDLRGERARLFLAQEAEAWLTDRGYRVNVLDVKDDGDELSWYIQGALYRGLDEAIPYALSAANAAAEYRRQGQAGGGYRGRIDIPVQSREDYLAVGQALTKAARAAGERIDFGLSDGVMSVFSDSMTADELDKFIDDVLDQGLTEDWKKVNRKDRTPGMSRKAVKAYRRENPGSKLQTAVTTKPSKLKKGSKSAKRRKSFCARMKGMKRAHAGAKTKRNPDSPINKALRRWNCESVEEMRDLIMIAEQRILAMREGGFDIPEIPRAPQPRPDPKNKAVGEGSVQDKLHRRHQELRKKSGLPDPNYYKELKATYDLPDEERYAKAAELKKKYQVKEARKAEANFDIEDLKRLEQIRDLPTLKAQAMALISKPSERPMKPEKVAWFDAALDRMDNRMAIIKLMYDLLLSGEGHQVIGSKRSMNPNSYRSRFGESTITNEDVEKYVEELERAGYEIVNERRMTCPECGGTAYSDQLLAEKQDACYHKVKSRYKVWPSAYASGALVRCRKKGAANWGNKSKK